jgi:hypothetical protein
MVQARREECAVGLLKRLKQGLGLGTVKVELSAPPQVGAADRVFEGTFTITAASEQRIIGVHVSFERRLSFARRTTHTDTDGHERDSWADETRTTELGSWEDSTPFTMAEGEEVEVAFCVPFEDLPAPYDTSLGSPLLQVLPPHWIDGTDYRLQALTYVVRATVDVDDAAFDKHAEQEVDIV